MISFGGFLFIQKENLSSGFSSCNLCYPLLACSWKKFVWFKNKNEKKTEVFASSLLLRKRASEQNSSTRSRAAKLYG